MDINRIKDIRARQVLDSDGRPAIEADVITESGVMGRSSAATGNSVGINESAVIRDGDPKLFGGKSVYKAIDNVNKIIAPALRGMSVTDQKAIDEKMIELDGTRYKTKLGGNTINAVSFAAARAGAASEKLPFYRYLANGKKIRHSFTPVYNLVNGGTYYGKTQAFQEFILIPRNVDSFDEAVRVGVEMFYTIGDIIAEEMKQKPVMGKYCGHGAPSDDPSVIFDIFNEAASRLGYKDKVCYGIDCASSEFYDSKDFSYRYRGRDISRDELTTLLKNLCEKYPIGFIEDPLNEEDFDGYKAAHKIIPAALIGDDLLCTNIERARKAYEMQAADGMIVKPNQVGTLTETMQTVDFLKEKNQILIASGRSGGPLDDPTTDLVVAIGGHMLKTGAPRSGERVVSINDGIHIAEELGMDGRPFNVMKLAGFSRIDK
ncbi:MAG: phosphopyruvate hydratase [Bacillota bacterium]|nr:phosphopyruvate hydratase [Bacillota bacterium]